MVEKDELMNALWVGKRRYRDAKGVRPRIILSRELMPDQAAHTSPE
jgi:hypothetical protein